MTSSRPYLLRAIYEWLLDNDLTPYVMIDAKYADVVVPKQFVEDGRIILNISPQAVGGLVMSNQSLEFDARFSGVAQHIYAPVAAVMAIYAFENGRGMVFSEKDDGGGDGPFPGGGDGGADSGGDDSGKKRPSHLKVVK